MIKKKNVGAQTQKKWRPRGPPLEWKGAEGWRVGGPEEWGPDLEKGLGAEGWGPKGWGAEPSEGGAPKGGAPKGGAPNGGAPNGGGPNGGGPKFRAFFSLSRLHFRSFFFSLSLWGSSRGMLVFEARERSNVHAWSSLTRQPESPNVHT